MRPFDRTLWSQATVPYPITVNSNLKGEDQLTNTQSNTGDIATSVSMFVMLYEEKQSKLCM